MSVHFGELAKKVGANGTVSAEEILVLRREAWPDGRISQAEAEAIFALDRQLESKSSEWVDFFVEALGEYVVNQRAPAGYVDRENASWLMMQIDHDGSLCSMSEVELLVRVFERASNVPQALKDYAISQMELAVLEGDGSDARWRATRRGQRHRSRGEAAAPRNLRTGERASGGGRPERGRNVVPAEGCNA